MHLIRFVKKEKKKSISAKSCYVVFPPALDQTYCWNCKEENLSFNILIELGRTPLKEINNLLSWLVIKSKKKKIKCWLVLKLESSSVICIFFPFTLATWIYDELYTIIWLLWICFMASSTVVVNIWVGGKWGKICKLLYGFKQKSRIHWQPPKLFPNMHRMLATCLTEDGKRKRKEWTFIHSLELYCSFF